MESTAVQTGVTGSRPHHHFGSPRWIKRVVEVKRQGCQQFEAYTPGKAIAATDAAGVSTAFLSCTEPGVWFGDHFAQERREAIALSRDMNDYGARIADYPYSTIVNHVELLKNAGMTPAELAGIDRENALRILPKYR